MRKTSFTKTVLLFFMIAMLSFLGFSKDKGLKSNWTSTPVKIDGFNDDWSGVTLALEKKVKVDYAFKNNAENLYVLFIFKDPKYLSSIGATGMTLWFNFEGKKKKNYGIKFIQKKIPPQALIDRLEKDKGPLPEEEKKRIQANPSYLVNDTEIINKKAKSSPQPSEKKEGKAAAFRFMKQESAMVFEFAIPLKNIADLGSGMEIKPGDKVKVGFEWGGVTKEMKAAIKQRSAALERSRTSSTDPSDNLASSGRSSVPMGVLSGPKKHDFWIDLQLAQNQ